MNGHTQVRTSKMMELLQLMERPYFYTYILLGSDGTYYTGITNDINRRLAQHQAGKSKSTSRKLPVTLIYLKGHQDRRTSRQLEVKIKLRGAKRYLDKFIHKGQEVTVAEWIDEQTIKEATRKNN